MPTDFAHFTRLMPAASSGASSPLSAASAASFLIADIMKMIDMMIDEDPRPRASSDTRQALTLALVPGCSETPLRTADVTAHPLTRA
jgi:hypothetical protein